ncbi:hypothetical protein [Prevotella sp. HUN102]|uniref:hypothetical protein n=1 Tax=Prevotella sp. HUN102 TaxID=1392486 RepID=UPI0012DC1192|nr:hypothetical protein [Prevotella sp. HUN102]
MDKDRSMARMREVKEVKESGEVKGQYFREMGNGKREMGNGEREMGNGRWKSPCHSSRCP